MNLSIACQRFFLLYIFYISGILTNKKTQNITKNDYRCHNTQVFKNVMVYAIFRRPRHPQKMMRLQPLGVKKGTKNTATGNDPPRCQHPEQARRTLCLRTCGKLNNSIRSGLRRPPRRAVPHTASRNTVPHPPPEASLVHKARWIRQKRSNG